MASDEIIRANLDTATQALFDISALVDNPWHAETTAGEIAQTAIAKIVARRMGAPEKYTEGRVSVQLPSPSSPTRQMWVKWVLAVDRDQRTGYAFEGPFLKPGLRHALPPGAVVLVHESERAGSKKLGIVAAVAVVMGDGSLGNAATASGAHWAMGLRDHVEEFLKHPRLPRIDAAAIPIDIGPCP